MKQATVYDSQGRILGRYSASRTEDLMRNLQGRQWIEGRVPRDHYIKNGQPVAMPARPDTQFHRHTWNYDTESWQLDTELTAQNIRRLRDQELESIDRVNPVWFYSLTDNQQAELAQYRQALLDVPQQSDFPSTVDWPSKPQWL